MKPFILTTSLLLFVFIIACGATATTSRTPRWACPSPVPLPYGPDGPVKAIERVEIGTATPTGDLIYADTTTYYEIWEQEYGHLGGPPFPAPTTYALIGANYALGQRIELWPMHVMVQAQAGAVINEPGIEPNSQQLHLITITWYNHASEAIAMDYRRVQLRAITDPNGAMVSDGNWGITARALAIAGITDLPSTIPVGTSQVTVPIIAPPGEPEVIEMTFLADPAFMPAMPTTTTGPGTPTATPVIILTATPTSSNANLQAAGENTITVQWSNAIWQAPGGPICDDPGVLTAWSDEDGAWGMSVPVIGVAAPPGSSRLIQLALNQVGKPYVWGAKGPERFDCSGLVSWAYAQIGISIPQGTAGQWPRMTPAIAPNIYPGDLVFFDIAGGGRIDHVGMLVGDLNGNGQMDMVHAANPELGVRVDYDIFASSYYAGRIRGYRTAR
jgi:cell wall-associated NlpC family hydrolase